MTQALFIDSTEIDWVEPPPPKFIKTKLKPLYCQGESVSERVYLVKVEPGGSIAEHAHGGDETFYVISGSGAVSLDGEVIQGIEGKLFFIPSRVKHGVINTGAEDLMLISMTRDGKQEECKQRTA